MTYPPFLLGIVLSVPAVAWSPKTVQVHGVVVVDEQTGKPVEQFAVQYRWIDSRNPSQIHWTGGERRAGGFKGGRFSIRHEWVHQGKAWVRILAEGYVPQVATAATEDGLLTETLLVRLKRGRELRGRVVDHTGNAVPGATVFLAGPEIVEIEDGKKTSGFSQPSEKTDAEGRFAVAGAAENEPNRVFVLAPSLHVWTELVKDPQREVTINLPPPATLVLRYDVADDDPLGRFDLRLKSCAMPGWQGVVGSVQRPSANNGGEVVLSNMTPGDYDLTRFELAGGNLSARNVFCDRKPHVTLRAGQATVLEFVRKAGQPITGQLTGPPGYNLEGALVCILGDPRLADEEYELTTFDAATGDAEGRFRTARIPPGTYTVIAQTHKMRETKLPPGVWVSGETRAVVDRIGTAQVTVRQEGPPPQVRIEMKPRAEFEKAAQATEKAPGPATGTGRELDAKESLKQLKAADAAYEAAFTASGMRPGWPKSKWKLTMLAGEIVYEEQIVEIPQPPKDMMGQFIPFRRTYYVGPKVQANHDWVGRIRRYGPLDPWPENSPGPATAGFLKVVKPDAPTYMLLIKRPLLCLGRGYSRYISDVKEVSREENGRFKVTAEGIDLGFRPGARWELLIDPDAAHMVRSAKLVDEKNRTMTIVNSGLKRYGPRCVPEKAECKGAFIDASFEIESASPEADVALLKRAKAAMRPPYLMHMDVHDERVTPELYVPYDAGKTSPQGRRKDWDIGF